MRRILRWLRGQWRPRRRPQPAPPARHDPRRGRRRRDDLGMRVRYSCEETILGSAGGPRRALPSARRRPVLHRQRRHAAPTSISARSRRSTSHSGALVTMALVRNPDPAAYGGVDRSTPAAAVTGFVPARAGEPLVALRRRPGRRGIGVRGAAADRPAETVGRRLPAADRRSARAASARSSATRPFRDIGTPADYLASSLTGGRAAGGRPASLLIGAAVPTSTPAPVSPARSSGTM